MLYFIPCEACLLLPVGPLHASTYDEHMTVGFANVRIYTLLTCSRVNIAHRLTSVRHNRPLPIRNREVYKLDRRDRNEDWDKKTHRYQLSNNY